jgi:hypothetical protein
MIKKLIVRMMNGWRPALITFHQMGNNGFGRLGNQLFQYAALRSLACRTNRRLILPPVQEHRLSAFRITASFSPVLGEPRMPHEFRERQFHYDESFFKAPPNCDFSGFFQSERYFVNIADRIRREFTLVDPTITQRARQQVNAVRARYPGRPVVALHNRRGDNVPTPHIRFDCKYRGSFRPDKERYHPLLKPDYIEAGLRYFEGCCFLVFSDTVEDRAWCREHVFSKWITISEGNDDLTDFEMQRLCDHNIIANSSFSWWAAWLNPHSSRKVVAPSQWFGEMYAHYILDDLIPKDWVRL